MERVNWVVLENVIVPSFSKIPKHNYAKGLELLAMCQNQLATSELDFGCWGEVRNKAQTVWVKGQGRIQTSDSLFPHPACIKGKLGPLLEANKLISI